MQKCSSQSPAPHCCPSMVQRAIPYFVAGTCKPQCTVSTQLKTCCRAGYPGKLGDVGRYVATVRCAIFWHREVSHAIENVINLEDERKGQNNISGRCESPSDSHCWARRVDHLLAELLKFVDDETAREGTIDDRTLRNDRVGKKESLHGSEAGSIPPFW